MAKAIAAQVKNPKKKSATQRELLVTFKTAPGRAVFVAGTFNGWAPRERPMKETSAPGLYSAQLRLAPGLYEYKFVVDGAWVPDVENPQRTPDRLGGWNSVLSVV